MTPGLAGVEVQFVGSFPDPLVRLEPPLPEVAVIGRSNVGKTTLLNAYRLPDLYLIDLPGYGFARASKAERDRYRTLITRYLRERATLAGVAWLLDVRHDPSRDDHAIQELLVASERPVLAVLTKADKLGRTAQRERTRAIGRALGLPDDQVQLTSARTGLGIAELGASIQGLLAVGGSGRDRITPFPSRPVPSPDPPGSH